MNPVHPAGFSIGATVSATFDVIRHNRVASLVLTLMAVMPRFVLIWYIPVSSLYRGFEFSYPVRVVLAAATGTVISLFFNCFLHGALAYTTFGTLAGQRVTLRASILTGLKNLLPLFAIGLARDVALGFALAALIVPGLLLAAAWSVVTPVYVLERTSLRNAFRRSLALTKGHRWRIVALITIFITADYALELARGMFAFVAIRYQTSFSILGIASFAIGGVIAMIAELVVSTGVCVIYYKLRTAKEGLGPGVLASVFD